MLQIKKYLLEKIAVTAQTMTAGDIAVPVDNTKPEMVEPPMPNAGNIESEKLQQQQNDTNKISRYIVGKRVSAKGRNMDNYDMDMAHNDLADIYNYANGQQPIIADYSSIKPGLPMHEHAAEVARINALRDQQRAYITYMQKSPEYTKFQELKEQYKNDQQGYQQALNDYWNDRVNHRLQEYNKTYNQNKQNLMKLYKAQPHNYKQEVEILNIPQNNPKPQTNQKNNAGINEVQNKMAPTNLVPSDTRADSLYYQTFNKVDQNINKFKRGYATDIHKANQALNAFNKYYYDGSLVNTLNKRFDNSKDWMQGAIQAFSLFNKYTPSKPIPNIFVNPAHAGKSYQQVYNSWRAKNPELALNIDEHPLTVNNLIQR